MKRPLVIFALAFCIGIFVASKVPAPFFIFYLLALASLLLSLLFQRSKCGFNLLLCLFIFFCAASRLKDFEELPANHALKLIPYKKDYVYTVKGMIENYPLFKDNRTTFIFRTREVTYPESGFNTATDILVNIKGKADLYYAQDLIIKGRLYRPSAFRGLSRQSRRGYLSNQGIHLLMDARQIYVIEQSKSGLAILRKLPYTVREKIEEAFYKRVSPLAASIMSAMVLGERKGIPWLVNDAMVKSGTVHILVVSGFNVGLVAFLVVLLLKLFRVPRVLRFYLAMPTIVTYCLMTGASTPVFRATLMAVVFMFAYLVKREADIYNSLAVAAIAILAVNPRQLFDVGFQLSFLSVVSLVFLYPRVKVWLHTENIRIKYIRVILDGCLVSFSAWVGTMGLVAYYFKIFSPVTVLANMFIVPLASLITLSGFSLLLADFTCPFLAVYFARSTEFIVALLLNINTLLLKIPGAYLYLP